MKNNQIDYKVIKLRETIKIGEQSLIELDPNYLEKSGAKADVFEDERGITVRSVVEFRGNVQEQTIFIPYSGIRYISYK